MNEAASNYFNENTTRNPETSIPINSGQSAASRPPQNSCPNHNPPAAARAQERPHCSRASRGSVFSGLRPFIEEAKNGAAFGRIKNWLRDSNHPEQSTSSSLPDSFIINFETVPETSSPRVGFLKKIPNKVHSGQHRAESTTIDISGHEEQSSGRHTRQHSSVNNNNDLAVESVENLTNQYQETSMVLTRNSMLANGDGGDDVVHANDVVENQSLDKFISTYTSFLAFLLTILIYDHREGILIFIGLFVTFLHGNSVIKREIAKKSRKSFFSIGVLFLNLSLCIFFILFVFREQKLYKSLVFILPNFQPLTLWDLLWVVGVTDFVLKFITIQLKIGLVLIPDKLMSYSARGKWYLMLEATSQVYRSLVPIQPWLNFLNKTYGGNDSTLGMVFSAFYIISKGSEIRFKAKLFIKSFWKLLKDVSLGVRPTKEQLENNGFQCPICHDEYICPIVLHCKHIFCEDCVSTWFDREQTCPLCREKESVESQVEDLTETNLEEMVNSQSIEEDASTSTGNVTFNLKNLSEGLRVAFDFFMNIDPSMERRLIFERQIANATSAYQSELKELLKTAQQEKMTKYFKPLPKALRLIKMFKIFN